MRYPFPSPALLFAVIAASGQTAKHPFNVDDWAAIHTASPAAISPDGLTILSSQRLRRAQFHENGCGILPSGGSGEVGRTVEMLRPLFCLIRSVRA